MTRQRGTNVRRFLEGYGVKLRLRRESKTPRPINVVWVCQLAAGLRADRTAEPLPAISRSRVRHRRGWQIDQSQPTASTATGIEHRCC